MATQTKISRSRANHVWATVRSVEMPEICARELFSDVLEARAWAKSIRADVDARAAAEQQRLANMATA